MMFKNYNDFEKTITFYVPRAEREARKKSTAAYDAVRDNYENADCKIYYRSDRHKVIQSAGPAL